MKFEDYHEWTPITAAYGTDTDFQGMAYASLGLSGEIGELADVLIGLHGAAGRVANQVKKMDRDDAGALTKERQDKVADELGDVFWYLSQMCHRLDMLPETIMARNQEKLVRRLEQGTIFGDKRQEDAVSPCITDACVRPAETQGRACCPACASVRSQFGRQTFPRQRHSRACNMRAARAPRGSNTMIVIEQEDFDFDEEPEQRLFFIRLTAATGTMKGRTIVRRFFGTDADDARRAARLQYGKETVIHALGTSAADVEEKS